MIIVDAKMAVEVAVGAEEALIYEADRFIFKIFIAMNQDLQTKTLYI